MVWPPTVPATEPLDAPMAISPCVCAPAFSMVVSLPSATPPLPAAMVREPTAVLRWPLAMLSYPSAVLAFPRAELVAPVANELVPKAKAESPTAVLVLPLANEEGPSAKALLPVAWLFAPIATLVAPDASALEPTASEDELGPGPRTDRNGVRRSSRGARAASQPRGVRTRTCAPNGIYVVIGVCHRDVVKEAVLRVHGGGHRRNAAAYRNDRSERADGSRKFRNSHDLPFSGVWQSRVHSGATSSNAREEMVKAP